MTTNEYAALGQRIGEMAADRLEPLLQRTRETRERQRAALAELGELLGQRRIDSGERASKRAAEQARRERRRQELRPPTDVSIDRAGLSAGEQATSRGDRVTTTKAPGGRVVVKLSDAGADRIAAARETDQWLAAQRADTEAPQRVDMTERVALMETSGMAVGTGTIAQRARSFVKGEMDAFVNALKRGEEDGDSVLHPDNTKDSRGLTIPCYTEPRDAFERSVNRLWPQAVNAASEALERFEKGREVAIREGGRPERYGDGTADDPNTHRRARDYGTTPEEIARINRLPDDGSREEALSALSQERQDREARRAMLEQEQREIVAALDRIRAGEGLVGRFGIQIGAEAGQQARAKYLNERLDRIKSELDGDGMPTVESEARRIMEAADRESAEARKQRKLAERSL